jgi:hypothetical protein
MTTRESFCYGRVLLFPGEISLLTDRRTDRLTEHKISFFFLNEPRPRAIVSFRFVSFCSDLFERAHFSSIQAGLFAGLAGHNVDGALKVKELDEDGRVVLHASTLDEFEQFWKIVVDFGLGLCMLVNSGVEINGRPGAMTALVALSVVAGKFLGILLSFECAKSLGFTPP